MSNHAKQNRCTKMNDRYWLLVTRSYTVDFCQNDSV